MSDPDEKQLQEIWICQGMVDKVSQVFHQERCSGPEHKKHTPLTNTQHNQINIESKTKKVIYL